MALLPGAVVVAVGLEGLHLFTVYFLGPKLANATELYGVLGVVSTILFWLYIVGRLVVGAATVNASLHEQSTLTPPEEAGQLHSPGKGEPI
jgi:membrane protein